MPLVAQAAMHQPAAASRRASSSTVATNVAGSLSAPPSDDGTSIRKNPPATRASTTSRESLPAALPLLGVRGQQGRERASGLQLCEPHRLG